MKSALLDKSRTKPEARNGSWIDVPSTGLVLDPRDYPINTFGTDKRLQNEVGQLRVGSVAYDVGRMVDNSGREQWVISTDHRTTDNPKKKTDGFSYVIDPNDDGITIGRLDSNTIVPKINGQDADRVSRVHAHLKVNEWGDLVIRDQESTNGTSFRRHIDQRVDNGKTTSNTLGRQAVSVKAKRPRPQPVKAMKEAIDARPRLSKKVQRKLGACALAALSLVGAYQAKSQIASAVESAASTALEFVKDIDIRGSEQNEVVKTVVHVEEGDTLSEIAARQGVDLADIYATNPDIGPEDVIHPGQPIVLPPPSEQGLRVLQEQREAERAAAEQEAAERRAEMDAEQAQELAEMKQQIINDLLSKQKASGDNLNMSDPSAQWEFILQNHLNQQKINDIIAGSYFEVGYQTKPAYDTHLSAAEAQEQQIAGLQLIGIAGRKIPVYVSFNESQQCNNNPEILNSLSQIVQHLPKEFFDLAGAKLVVIGVDQNGDNVGGYWNASRGLVMGDCAESELTANRLIRLITHEFAHGIDTTLDLRGNLEIDFTQIPGADYIGDYEGNPLGLGYIRDVFKQFENDGKVSNLDLDKYNPIMPEMYYTAGPNQVFASLYGASSEAEQIAETIEDMMGGNVISNDPSHPSYGSPYHQWQMDLIREVENDPNGWASFGEYLSSLNGDNHVAAGAHHDH